MKYPYIAPALQRQSFFIVTNEDVPQLSVSQLDSKIPWPSLDRLLVRIRFNDSKPNNLHSPFCASALQTFHCHRKRGTSGS